MLIVDASCLFETLTHGPLDEKIGRRLAADRDHAAPHILDVEVFGAIRRDHQRGILDTHSCLPGGRRTGELARPALRPPAPASQGLGAARHRARLGCAVRRARRDPRRRADHDRPATRRRTRSGLSDRRALSTRAPTGRYAPSPTGTLHLGNLRTALLAWLFARSQGARFLMRIDDLDRGRVRPGVAEQQLADLAALGPGLGRAGRAPVRAPGALRRGDRAPATPTALLYPCFCTRAEIREAASAPHGPLPEGAYPGTCRELSAAQRAERERGGTPARAAPARRRRASSRSPTGCSARAGTRSTISSCAATTAPRHTISPWSSTTQRKGSARSCAARTCWTRRRASCTSAALLGLPAPALRPRPARARPRRRAPGQAPRRRHARRSRRRRRVAARGARAARAPPSGSPSRRRAPVARRAAASASIPSALPSEPTRADRMIAGLVCLGDRS